MENFRGGGKNRLITKCRGGREKEMPHKFLNAAYSESHEDPRFNLSSFNCTA